MYTEGVPASSGAALAPVILAEGAQPAALWRASVREELVDLAAGVHGELIDERSCMGPGPGSKGVASELLVRRDERSCMGPGPGSVGIAGAGAR